MGIVSKGQTFGDTDACRDRNYMYTLKTVSAGASAWTLNKTEFLNHVAACSKLHELKMFTLLSDTKLVNQLAANLRNNLDGLKLDIRLQQDKQQDTAKQDKPEKKGKKVK